MHFDDVAGGERQLFRRLSLLRCVELVHPSPDSVELKQSSTMSKHIVNEGVPPWNFSSREGTQG